MARSRRKKIVTDTALLRQAERVLARVRRISQSLSDKPDPERRRETRGLLRWTYRQIADYRKGLEALRDHPDAGPAARRRRPVCRGEASRVANPRLTLEAVPPTPARPAAPA